MNFMNGNNFWNIFLDLIRIYPKRFGLMVVLFILEFFIASLSVLSILPISQFFLDPALQTPHLVTKYAVKFLGMVGLNPGFLTLSSIFVISNILKSLMDIVIQRAILIIKFNITGDLLEDTLKNFFQARWTFFLDSERGIIFHAINKEVEKVGEFFSQAGVLASNVLQLGVYLIIPFTLNPKLTVIASLLALVFAMPFLYLSRVGYKYGVENIKVANQYTSLINEALRFAQLIIIFGMQKNIREECVQSFKRHARISLKTQVIGMMPYFFRPMALIAVIMAIALSSDGKIDFPSLAAILWSLISALPLISLILRSNTSLAVFLPSYQQLASLNSTATMLREPEGGVMSQSLNTSIAFRDVSFSYSNQDFSLKNISLQINVGKITALIGQSGSGKSTIIDLIMGFQTCQSGGINVDNSLLSNVNLANWRMQIGLVSQNPMLFSGSIRKNLLLSKPGASEYEMWESLKSSNAYDFVKSLRLGLDAEVGESGTLLSVGQRQRIAVARAIIRRPRLLILDEATSSLDHESEVLIKSAIKTYSRGAAVLVIAHKASVISDADYFYVLRDGAIEAQGKADDLTADKESYFSKMIDNG